MKKRNWKCALALLLAVLLLAGCGPKEPLPPEQTEQPPTETVQPEDPVEEDTGEDERIPVPLEHLTVELVVDWIDSDRLLDKLEDLRLLLGEALLTAGYQVEEISITISTAGGMTADAVVGGGVDLAILSSLDFLSCESRAWAVLITDEVPCETVVAVSRARGDLGQDFCTAVEQALLDTEQGAAFLHLYRSGETYLPASEEAIRAVREHFAEQEEQ